MRRQTSVLVSLVGLMDWLPRPSEPTQRPRGRPKTSSDRLVMKALIIRLMRRRYTASALFTLLDQDDSVAAQWRPLLHDHGGFPARRPWERRLAQRPPSLPGLLGYGGRYLVALLNPWATHGRAVACDSAPLATGEGVWHNKHREQGLIPHSSIATCSGLQTVAPKPANKGHFRLTFRANERTPGLTITANKPTFGSWPLLVMWFGGAMQVYTDVYI